MVVMKCSCRVIILRVFLIITSVIAVARLEASAGEEKKKPRKSDECHQIFAEEICKGKYRKNLTVCAGAMPANEQVVAFKCIARMWEKHKNPKNQCPKNKEWDKFFDFMCSPKKRDTFPEPPQKGLNFMFCFDNTLNETVQQGKMENDNQYPADHFKFKNKLVKDCCVALPDFKDFPDFKNKPLHHCKLLFGCPLDPTKVLAPGR